MKRRRKGRKEEEEQKERSRNRRGLQKNGIGRRVRKRSKGGREEVVKGK